MKKYIRKAMCFAFIITCAIGLLCFKSRKESCVTAGLKQAEVMVNSAPVASGAVSPVMTQAPGASAEPTKEPAESAGWHGKGKKKYYIGKSGERVTGYKKIKEKYYFFDKKTGYALISKWKSVKISGKYYRLYFSKNGSREMDLSKRMDKLSGVTYRIETNLTTNSVMVYAKWKTKGYSIPVKRMRCSVGMPGHSTRQGTYRLRKAGGRWRVLRYGCYGQYCTRFSGPYLYHSVVYKQYGNRYSLDPAEYKKLGKAASHGCVRLQVEDAKWIYDHASLSTTHVYAGKKEKLPLPYPAKKKIGKKSGGRYYDPTDV